MSVTQINPRLFAVKDVVDSDTITALHSINWLDQPYVRDPHYDEDHNFRRRILTQTCTIQLQVEHGITDIVKELAAKIGINYFDHGTTWYLCESGYQCPMHTDGQKPNVLILYWISSDENYGTTFYHSRDYNDIMHRFPSVPNTGVFANYEPESEQDWAGLWHAANNPVPEGSYRLITMSELYR
jgi:hypothetical protein